MITVAPMNAADLEEILPYMGGQIHADQMSDRVFVWEGRHVAMRIDGHLIGCGGLTVFWEGVAEAWLQLTPLVNVHLWSFYRAVMAFIHESARQLGLHRVQALVRIHDDKGHRFMRHLGWTCEGCLRQGDADRTDLYLYALVAEKEPL